MPKPPEVRLLTPEILPAKILAEARTASREAVLIEREGRGRGSLTDDGLRYSVLDYAACSEHAPRLCEWSETLPPLVSALTGVPLVLLDEGPSRLNINVLEGEGERYELHYDSVPWTAIIFASGPHDGGELLCTPDESQQVLVKPYPGLIAVFEGYRVAHCVLPLRDNTRRISIPVAFAQLGSPYQRPAGIDEHLYATTP